MTPANLIYFGSPDFSARILASLLPTAPTGLDPVGKVVGVASPPAYVVCGVVTTPDKPTGRKQVLTPSAVAEIAEKYDLPVFKPEKLNNDNLSHLKILKPDLFLVISYGKVLPSSWLTAPKIGTFNLHFSLLPKYRGALCVNEAIRNEDRETGVTLMVMDEGMDTGPIISQAKIAIDIDDNNETLTNKLTQAGIMLLAEYLPRLATPSAPPPFEEGGWVGVPQNNAKASYTATTKTRTRENAFLDWHVIQKTMNGENAPAVHALIRSNNPDPGAWTKINDIELKIIQSSLTPSSPPPYQGGGWVGVLKIDTVQLPGKQPISWKNFLAGHSL